MKYNQDMLVKLFTVPDLIHGLYYEIKRELFVIVTHGNIEHNNDITLKSDDIIEIVHENHSTVLVTMNLYISRVG